MKVKTTTKYIKAVHNNIKCAGYCELSNLLRGREPIAYTCGVYGWNYDVYFVKGVTICTGYRGMPGARVQGAAEYEQKARAIWDDYNKSWDDRAADVENLLKEFCKLNGGY